MFRKFRVQNFMCLRDVTVELGPLTVIAGPNSAGKSALFKALATLSRLLRFPTRGDKRGDFAVEPGIGLDQAVWKGDSGLPMIFDVWFSDGAGEDPDYTLELRRDAAGWNVKRERFMFRGDWLDSGAGFHFDTSAGPRSFVGPYRAPLSYVTYDISRRDPTVTEFLQPIQDLRDRIGESRRYRPSASDIALPSLGRPVRNRSSAGEISAPSPANNYDDEARVDEAGRGLPRALQELLTTDRKSFESLEHELARLHPHIMSLSFKSDWRGVGLYYRTSRATDSTPASLESDGVLLTTFLLWRLYSGGRNLKFCLEEPENGIHVSGLRERYDLLNRFAQSEKVQVLVSTHSRDFLNALTTSEALEQIRIIEFDPEDGTKILPLTHYRDAKHLLEQFKGQMGDLWWSGRLRASPSAS